MKYFFIAGEASGDLHASNLIRYLKIKDEKSIFIGLGGHKMRDAGCTIIQDYSQMAFMGFIAVILNLHKVINNFRIVHTALIEEQPDVLILIDYPSFNLPIAKFAKKHLNHIKVVYYIPPKVWAWKTFRLRQLSKYCDDIFAIFPFEEMFYKQRGYTCKYVGNPTVESVATWKKQHANAPKENNKPFIAILPGSRKWEIKHCLPLMLKVARQFPQFDIKVCRAPSIDENYYTTFLNNGEVLTPDTYATLTDAHFAIVNSGTATLETALLGCPQVSLYYVAFSKLLGWLKPLLFKVKYFTLVNILLNKEVIKEMVSYKFSYKALYNEVHHIINDANYRQNMLTQYKKLQTVLGDGFPSENVARQIIENQKP